MPQLRREPTVEQIAAKSPRSAWHPEMGQVYRMVKDHIPADRVGLILESFHIARTSSCLQPPSARYRVDARAVARIGQLWEEMSGAKRQGGGQNLWKYLLGGVAGLLGGLVMGYAIRAGGAAEFPPMLLALLGAVIGAGAGHFLQGAKGFEFGMMKLIINERRSPVRKEMVTDQCELWVPKALLWHRQGEWRRDRNGSTYMWVNLPYREKLTSRIRNMVDGLALALDLHVMLDSAGKGQRVWNRRLAKNAQDFGHLDDGEEPPRRMEEMMPHLLGGGLALGGIIIVIVVAQ